MDCAPALGSSERSGRLFFERPEGFVHRDMRRFFRARQTRAACSEPSYSMPFVRLCDDVIGHELSPVGLRDSFLQVGPFLIAEDVDPGVPRLDLARIFRKLDLILLRPRGDLLEECFGSWAHTTNIRPVHRLCQPATSPRRFRTTANRFRVVANAVTPAVASSRCAIAAWRGRQTRRVPVAPMTRSVKPHNITALSVDHTPPSHAARDTNSQPTWCVPVQIISSAT